MDIVACIIKLLEGKKGDEIWYLNVGDSKHDA